MKHLLQIFIIILTLFSCKTKKNVHQKSDKVYKNHTSEQLKIVQVGRNTFQHTSYLKTKSFGLVPCNGMIYINGNEAIIFDTPTNDEASIELINWIGKEKIKAVVATHFHVDCLGGLEAFHSNGIASYATNQTIQLAKEKHKPLPQNGFENQHTFTIGNEVVIAKYFGPGHTKDNITGYIPSEKILFGGCLIKALDASKGNLADANINEWSSSVEKIKETYPNVEKVIPGHGKNGGKSLLDYTINLFK